MDQDEALDHNAFLAELDDLVNQSKDILLCSKFLNKFEVAFMQKYASQLHLIRLDILSFKNATKSRFAPYGVLVYGNSGIGKTSIIKILIHQYCIINDIPDRDDLRYYRNFKEEFWNNYQTCMTTIILDDVASEHPGLGSTISVDDIICVMNDANYVPNQARLEDKGRIACRPKFVIATTNKKDLHANTYFTTPVAALRRLPDVLTVTVKPEFRNPITGGLASQYCGLPDDPTGEYEDYWLFKFEKVNAVPINVSKTIQDLPTYTVIGEDMNMEEMITMFTGFVLAHNENKVVLKNSQDQVRSVKACDACKLPLKYCKCQLQSIEGEIFRLAWLNIWVSLTQEVIYAGFFLILPYLGFFGFFNTGTIAYVMARPVLAFKLFERMGRRVSQIYTQPRTLVILAAMVTTVFTAYRLMKSVSGNLQGSNQSKEKDEEEEFFDSCWWETDMPGQPKPMKADANSNVWYKGENLTLTPFDLTSQIISAKSLDFGAFSQILLRNCAVISVTIKEDIKRISKCFALSVQVYITNNHCLPNFKEITVVLTQQPIEDGVTTNTTFILCENDIMRFPDRDLAAFRVACIAPKKNLTKYFCKKSYRANTHASYLSRTPSGHPNIKEITNIKYISNARVGSFTERINLWEGSTMHPTVNGDCGSIMVAHSELGPCIVGIHALYENNKVVSVSLDNEIIDEIIAHFYEYSVGGNPPMLQSGSIKPQIIKLHAKSTLRYVETGVVSVYGSILGHRAQSKSRVENTIMAESMAKYNILANHFAPATGWLPFRVALLDMTCIDNCIRSDIVELCVEGYLKDISSCDLTHIHPYDHFVAVNGAQGVNYVDKLVRNTSLGFPWGRSKNTEMHNIPAARGLDDPMDFSEDVLNVVKEMEERYRNYERASPVFTAHLKDEAVSAAKLAAGKTRVFSGAPTPFTIIMRKFMLSYTRVSQNNQFLFESAPGLISQSDAWHQLYKHLAQHGTDRGVAGDFAKYDKKMAAVFIIAAFKIIKSVCAMSNNYSKEQLDTITCIGYDIAFSFQSFNGDLIQFFGSNPSGHSLTVTVNCIVNCLYMRYAYYLANPNKEVHTFKQNICLMTYGDDNIMTVSKSIDWFNHTILAEKLHTIGVTYTMPDKAATSVPFTPLKDLSFLKRAFRYDHETKHYMAILEEASMNKSLTVWVRSKSITSQEQAISIISSANSEYFYYGRELYDKKQAMFRTVIKECNLTAYVQKSTLPTWDSLLSDYRERCKRRLAVC